MRAVLVIWQYVKAVRVKSRNNNNLIWHQRLGHINNECLKRLGLSTLGSNIKTSNSTSNNTNNVKKYAPSVV